MSPRQLKKPMILTGDQGMTFETRQSQMIWKLYVFNSIILVLFCLTILEK